MSTGRGIGGAAGVDRAMGALDAGRMWRSGGPCRARVRTDRTGRCPDLLHQPRFPTHRARPRSEESGVDTLIFASAELYNPKTSTLSATSSMTTPRLLCAAIRLPDGRILIVGGYASLSRRVSWAGPYALRCRGLTLIAWSATPPRVVRTPWRTRGSGCPAHWPRLRAAGVPRPYPWRRGTRPWMPAGPPAPRAGR